MKRTLLFSLALAIPFLVGCAAAGDLSKIVGSGLSDYSSRNSGFLAGAAGVAGGVYTKAGNLVSPDPKPGDAAPETVEKNKKEPGK